MKLSKCEQAIIKESGDLILLMEAEAVHATSLKAIAHLMIREMRLNRSKFEAMRAYNEETLNACKDIKKELSYLRKSVLGQKKYLIEKYNATKKVHADAQKAAEKFKNGLLGMLTDKAIKLPEASDE